MPPRTRSGCPSSLSLCPGGCRPDRRSRQRPGSPLP
uniref:Uncharacterized protein n=1 Tax=Arundo donax TaxID=35708 RepID=A0A0A9GWJ2_ARUDO